jgi:hypothetical protein
MFCHLDLKMQIPGILTVAEPLAVLAFRKENVRILAELNRYVEAQLLLALRNKLVPG